MRRGALVVSVLALLPIGARAQDYKAYQNYDFVAGDRIIFEDDFRGDADGEFPAHWKLESGQAVVNKVDGEPALALTDGDYAVVSPRIKGDAYLPQDAFSIEFDFFPKPGGFEKVVVYIRQQEGSDKELTIGSDVSTLRMENDLTASYPGEYAGRWHHVAIACKNGQMNMLQALTKDGKVVTHILFDVNSSTVKPQSMGTIGEIGKAADPALKLEIGGHADSDGDAAKNTALSQARAEAVKKLLVDQGIDAARLTPKGYGAAKPIAPNDTPEGKANNRRLEFSKVA